MKSAVTNNQIRIIGKKMDKFYPHRYLSGFSDSNTELLGLVLFLIFLFLIPGVFRISAQQMQTQYFAQTNNNQNYMRSSSAFRQEIARFEMTVHRAGKQPLPLSQVPRVQQGDVIKVKLLEEAVNGVKLDQSLYNWTMLAAFINPNRKVSGGQKSVIIL